MPLWECVLFQCSRFQQSNFVFPRRRARTFSAIQPPTYASLRCANVNACISGGGILFFYLSLSLRLRQNQFYFPIVRCGTQRYLPPHHQGIYDCCARSISINIILPLLCPASHHDSGNRFIFIWIHQ
jgi:hypothetical protein